MRTVEDGGVVIGLAETPQTIRLDRANRHGLIAGATGSGKTVTLQVLAQGFSDAGVPVFAADVKGDLSGVCVAAASGEKLLARAADLGVALEPKGAPTVFFDLFGRSGHPIRATVSEMGPVMLARLFDLNDVQEGVLTIAFRIADEEGLLLLDLNDLRAVLAHLAENAQEIGRRYGNVAPATIGALQRQILTLESQGGDGFFGEPALRLSDLMRLDSEGRGYVSLLSADRLISNPRLYATFLLWLMSELFEELPEVGDPEKPRLVFFFDEAHLLFRDAPRPLLEKIEQVVRLIRSKGVGIYFVTQNPADIPDSVLSQLGNRIQHALRAYTPAEQRGLKAAADAFRANPAFDTAEAIQALAVGEALVSALDAKGVPQVVARTRVRPPNSRIGPALPPEREAVQARSPLRGLYDQTMDRESAYERLSARARSAPEPAAAPRTREPERHEDLAPRRASRQTPTEAFVTSLTRAVASQLGREIMRGVLGGLRRR